MFSAVLRNALPRSRPAGNLPKRKILPGSIGVGSRCEGHGSDSGGSSPSGLLHCLSRRGRLWQTTNSRPGKARQEAVTLMDLMDLFPDEKTATHRFNNATWGEARYCGRYGSLSTSRTPNAKPLPYSLRLSDCSSSHPFIGLPKASLLPVCAARNLDFHLQSTREAELVAV